MDYTARKSAVSVTERLPAGGVFGNESARAAPRYFSASLIFALQYFGDKFRQPNTAPLGFRRESRPHAFFQWQSASERWKPAEHGEARRTSFAEVDFKTACLVA
jgi:hypothetical protein